MAKYSFQVFPKDGIDYRLDGNVSNLKKFLTDASKKGIEIAAADSRTRHDMEQLYMDESYRDEKFARLYGRSVFLSESQRKNVKSGKMRPIRSLTVSINGNNGG